MMTKSRLKEQDVLLKGDGEPPLSEQGLGTENLRESHRLHLICFSQQNAWHSGICEAVAIWCHPNLP